MSWRTSLAHTLASSLVVAACGGASPAPSVESRQAPPVEAPAQPVGQGGVAATPAPVLEQPEAATPEPEPAVEAAAQEPVDEARQEAPQQAPEESEPEQRDEPAPAPASAEAAPDEIPPRNPWLDDPRLEGMFVFDRGLGNLPIAVARDEQLSMNVRVRLGIAGSPKLGTVTMTSRVVPHRASLMRRDADAETELERAELVAIASGGNALYNLVEERKSLLLPQPWPHIRHTSDQTGTEHRKREQDLGWGDDGYHTRFRSDHHCRGCELRQHFVEPTWAWQDPRHCKKCKRGEHRVWNVWNDRPIPEESVDMLTAVTLARTMLLLDEDEMTFPLIDKEELWQLTIRRGRSERIEVDAGEFDATEIQLETRPYPGEDADPKDFKGLFGIHGTVSIWFDRLTGVPVQISGVVPLGPFTLDATVELASYRGTPPGFRPVR